MVPKIGSTVSEELRQLLIELPSPSTRCSPADEGAAADDASPENHCIDGVGATCLQTPPQSVTTRRPVLC